MRNISFRRVLIEVSPVFQYIMLTTWFECKRYYLHYYIFTTIFGNILGANIVGDKCSFKDGSIGKCRFLSNCQFALDSLAQGVFPENSCDFVGTQSIFCCEDEEFVKPTVSTSTTQGTTLTAPSSTSITTLSTTSTVVTTQSTTTTAVTTIEWKNDKRKPGDISKKKCEEYAKYAYDDSEAPVLIIRPQYAHTLECAFEKLPLIVGGTLATRHEFPHMALIGFETEHDILWDCGGSLISENFILTAAHCIHHRQAGPAKHVKLGITNQTDTYNLKTGIVQEIFTPPQYTNKTKYHDIALLKLAESVELDIYVRPACLNTEKDIKQKNAIASGWGNVGFLDQGSNDLLKVVLELFPTRKCNKTYQRDIFSRKGYLKQGIVDDFMVCAGSSSEKKNTCQGDSGGPLQVYHEETSEIRCMYDILGVTSFGKSCGLAKDVPGVYTRVSTYIEWIESVVWPE